MDGWTSAGADKNRVISSYTKMTTPLLFLIIRCCCCVFLSFLPEKGREGEGAGHRIVCTEGESIVVRQADTLYIPK